MLVTSEDVEAFARLLSESAGARARLYEAALTKGDEREAGLVLLATKKVGGHVSAPQVSLVLRRLEDWESFVAVLACLPGSEQVALLEWVLRAGTLPMAVRPVAFAFYGRLQALELLPSHPFARPLDDAIDSALRDCAKEALGPFALACLEVAALGYSVSSPSLGARLRSFLDGVLTEGPAAAHGFGATLGIR